MQETQQQDTYQQPDDMAFAGSVLIDLAGRDSHDGRRKLFEYERQLLEDSFAVCRNQPDFLQIYVDALRLALKTKNHDVLEILLKKTHPTAYSRMRLTSFKSPYVHPGGRMSSPI